MSKRISENVFNKSKHKFGSYEEAKVYREAVVADLRDNRDMIQRNQVGIIALFMICICLFALIAAS